MENTPTFSRQERIIIKLLGEAKQNKYIAEIKLY
jgi:hypothetical protein